jgi:bla regulator protein blaR1
METLSALVRGITWTLIHSIWIGIITSLMAAVILWLTAHSTAKLRYRLLCINLFIFIAGIAGVFYKEIADNYRTAIFYRPLASLADKIVIPDHLISVQADKANWAAARSVLHFLDSQAYLLFGVWLTCFVFKLVSLSGGIFYMHKMLKAEKSNLPVEWKNKVNSFGKSLGIHRYVAVVMSKEVKTPFTWGIFRPLIMLPAGLMFQLPAEQVESILWHELAHIARHDYLIGFVQSLLEAVFFFNPGLLWLSGLIREERENCCDDITLQKSDRKSEYLKALLSLSQVNGASGALAMSAIGAGKSQLKRRLNRMIRGKRRVLSVTECGMLLSGLILISAFTFAQAIGRSSEKHILLTQGTILRNSDTAITSWKSLHRRGNGQLTHSDTLLKMHSIAARPLIGETSLTDDRQRVRVVITALVAHKSIPDPGSLIWFGLTEDELVVNGQKQSEALHKQLKVQLGIKRDYGLYYGPVQMTGTGVFIDKTDL